jgi:diadenosine tetraphosphate (Ap4A) HIT family hydrolase
VPGLASDVKEQQMPQSWKSKDWDALVSGDGCPVCDLLRTAEGEDEHGIAVADLRFSRLSLSKNQYVPGYCVLICRRHVIEPHELAADERMMFFDDLALVGKGLQAAFKADKMNYNILGNVTPHLHVHILPRYFTDGAPNRPIDPELEKVYLSAAEYAERIRLIQKQIGKEAAC